MSMNLNKVSVLIVEDAPAMSDLIEAVLASLGVKDIYKASDGRRGLEIVKKKNPDIILCDWEMPGFTGLDFTKELRTNEMYPNRWVPIIMITAYSSGKRVIHARDVGITEYLAKPFSAQTLASRLLSVIKKPRDFIETDDYCGPDRRRRQDPAYTGKRRRRSDLNI